MKVLGIWFVLATITGLIFGQVAKHSGSRDHWYRGGR